MGAIGDSHGQDIHSTPIITVHPFMNLEDLECSLLKNGGNIRAERKRERGAMNESGRQREREREREMNEY